MQGGDGTCLERVAVAPVDHLEDEGGEEVEALAVADGLVPAGVRQQHALEQRLVLLGQLPAEEAAARAVQVLRRGRNGDTGCQCDGSLTRLQSRRQRLPCPPV